MRRRPTSPVGGSSAEARSSRKALGARRVLAAVVVERAHADPLGAQQLEVDVGDAALRAPSGKRGDSASEHAVLVDHRLAVPRQIGGRLALARGGVDVGGQASRRRRAAQQGAVLGATDGDRAAAQVDQHGGAGQRGLGARRDRHPHVLADLDVDDEPGDVVGGEQQVRTERHVRRRADTDRAALVVAGGELATLVELAVRRQVRLRDDTEQPTAVDDDGGVVHAVGVAQRGADHEHRQQVGRRGDDRRRARPRRRRAARPAGRRPPASSPTASARGTRRRRRRRPRTPRPSPAPLRRCAPAGRSRW